MNNNTITIQRNYISTQAVFDHIKILSAKFRIHYRKGESVDLVYSQGGDLKNPTHNLAVWFCADNSKEVVFIKGLIEKLN
jgi:hypothetical protein